MASIQQKMTMLLTPSKMEVRTQTELSQKDVLVQVTGYRACYSLSLVAGVLCSVSR